MNHDNYNQNQINTEQDYVRSTGNDMLAGVKRARDGEHKPKLPNTEHALQYMQNSTRSNNLNHQGREVIKDVQNIIADEKQIIKKNDGDLIQNIIVHAWHLLSDISNTDTAAFMTMFEDRQNVLSSVCEAPEFSHLLSASGNLVMYLKDTEEFLTLASEMINLVRLLVVEMTEKLTDRREGNILEYKQQREFEKKELKEDVTALLRALSLNKIWIDVFKNGHSLFSKWNNSIDKNVPYKQIDKMLDNTNLDHLINSFHTFLQNLVGEKMNVEDLFKAVADVLYELSDSKALRLLATDAYDVLERISENSILLDDVYVQSRLQTLQIEGAQIYFNIMNSANVTKLKSESRRLLDSIKSEPVNQKLIQDVVKLWKDVKSDDPQHDHVIDPHLIENIRHVLRPMLLEHLNNIPLPDIHDTKDFMGRCTFALENIKLSAPALIPENIHLKIYHDMDANTRTLSAANQRTFIYIEAHDMHVCVHNVKWSYERLTSPHFTDQGEAHVRTTGKGIILRLKAEFKSVPSGEELIEVLDANCYIDGFHTEFTNSKHDIIYKMLSSVFASTIKKEVIKAVERKLMDLGHTLSTQITHIVQTAKSKSHTLSEALSTHHTSSVNALKYTSDRLKGRTEHAKTRLRELNENPVTADLKEDVKLRGKGAIVIASERAISMLDKQKVKIEEKRHALEESKPVQEEKKLASSIDDPFSNEMYDFLEMHTLTPPLRAGPFTPRTPSNTTSPQQVAPQLSLDGPIELEAPRKTVTFDDTITMLVGTAGL